MSRIPDLGVLPFVGGRSSGGVDRDGGQGPTGGGGERAGGILGGGGGGVVNKAVNLNNIVGDKITLNERTLSVQKRLGEGGFAFVFLVRDVSDGNDSSSVSGSGHHHHLGSLLPKVGSRAEEGADNDAMSTASAALDESEMVLKVTSIHTKEQREMAEKEAILLHRLSHPSIVMLHDVCLRAREGKVAPQHMILMEYCEKGHALDVIRRMKDADQRFSLKELIVSFGQICNAVSYLHAQKPPIVHRDLKLENFLVTRGGAQYKLCDFGSAVFGWIPLGTSRERSDAEEVIQKTTTQMYRAPEMIDLYMSTILTQSTDVWALGCCLFAMAFFQNCFGENSNLAILARNYKVPDKHGYGSGLVDLLDRMLAVKHEERADMTEVITCLSAIYSRRPLPPRSRAGAALDAYVSSDAAGVGSEGLLGYPETATGGSTGGSTGGRGGCFSGDGDSSGGGTGREKPNSTHGRGHISERVRRMSNEDKGSAGSAGSSRGGGRAGTFRTDGQGIHEMNERPRRQVKKQAKKLDPNSAAARRRADRMVNCSSESQHSPQPAPNSISSVASSASAVPPPPPLIGRKTPERSSAISSTHAQASSPLENGILAGEMVVCSPDHRTRRASSGDFRARQSKGTGRTDRRRKSADDVESSAIIGSEQKRELIIASVGRGSGEDAGDMDGFEATFDDAFGFDVGENPFHSGGASSLSPAQEMSTCDSADPFDFESIHSPSAARASSTGAASYRGVHRQSPSSPPSSRKAGFDGGGLTSFPTFDDDAMKALYVGTADSGLAARGDGYVFRGGSAGERGKSIVSSLSFDAVGRESTIDDGFSFDGARFPDEASSGRLGRDRDMDKDKGGGKPKDAGRRRHLVGMESPRGRGSRKTSGIDDGTRNTEYSRDSSPSSLSGLGGDAGELGGDASSNDGFSFQRPMFPSDSSGGKERGIKSKGFIGRRRPHTSLGGSGSRKAIGDYCTSLGGGESGTNDGFSYNGATFPNEVEERDRAGKAKDATRQKARFRNLSPRLRNLSPRAIGSRKTPVVGGTARMAMTITTATLSASGSESFGSESPGSSSFEPRDNIGTLVPDTTFEEV